MLSSLYSKRKRTEDGFTLIELLVVVIIIGVLAAIALPIFINQQKVAVEAAVKSDVRNTVTNVSNWRVDNRSAAVDDSAGYIAAGGKIAKTGTDVVNVTAKADGSFTVCGYNTGADKLTSADSSFAFDSTTGLFSAGVACLGDPSQSTYSLVTTDKRFPLQGGYQGGTDYSIAFQMTTDSPNFDAAIAAKYFSVSSGLSGIPTVTATCAKNVAAVDGTTLNQSFPITDFHAFASDGSEIGSAATGSMDVRLQCAAGSRTTGLRTPFGSFSFGANGFDASQSGTWQNDGQKVTFKYNGTPYTISK